jgi:hypothetical protein
MRFRTGRLPSPDLCGSKITSNAPTNLPGFARAPGSLARAGLRTGVVGSLLYALVRVLLDVIATSHGDQAKLPAEVLALRRQIRVLERQIERVHWTPGDRMVLAALRERIPRSAWASLLVKPETVLGWHRQLVRRKWAAYRGRPPRGRPPISDECRQLIIRMATDNPRWCYFRYPGRASEAGLHGSSGHDQIGSAQDRYPTSRAPI